MTLELEEKIAYYKDLLADPEKIKAVLKTELIAIRDKYGDDRRTEIQDVEDEIDIEDLIEEQECVYTLTHNGYIKRLPASEYRAQGRGGKGVVRTTYIINEQGIIEKVMPKVKPDTNAAEILTLLAGKQ